MKKLLTFALCAVLALGCAGVLYGCGDKTPEVTPPTDEQIITRLDNVISNLTAKNIVEKYGDFKVVSKFNKSAQEMSIVAEGASIYTVAKQKDEDGTIMTGYIKDSFTLNEKDGKYELGRYMIMDLAYPAPANAKKTIALTKGTLGNTLTYFYESDNFITVEYVFNANDSVAKMSLMVYNEEYRTVSNEFTYEKQTEVIPAAVKEVDVTTNAAKLELLRNEVEATYSTSVVKEQGGMVIKRVDVKLDDSFEESTITIDANSMTFEGSSGTQQYATGNDVFIADNAGVEYSFEPGIFQQQILYVPGSLANEALSVLQKSNAVLTTATDGAMTVKVGTEEVAEYVKLNKDGLITEVYLLNQSNCKQTKLTASYNVKVVVPEKIAAYQKTEYEKARNAACDLLQNFTLKKLIEAKGIEFYDGEYGVKVNFAKNYEEGVEIFEDKITSYYYKGDSYRLNTDGTAVDNSITNTFYDSYVTELYDLLTQEEITVTEDASTKNKIITFKTNDGSFYYTLEFLPSGLLHKSTNDSNITTTYNYGVQQITVPDFVKNHLA